MDKYLKNLTISKPVEGNHWVLQENPKPIVDIIINWINKVNNMNNNQSKL